ncbi:rhamnosyl transferase [Cryobacterium roopkundense]|uniref:Rhamnosyl transferase n=1 Tax=Cryobacterium roopkundense TaxID=1001240 RepID=A0A099JG05_9MICO|nr:glycosyltransferase family 2 protein [Cryobacterium roopkundense]KGJ77101.1 rhamnosyl transferase [Cryobacterium roopkundense]MBB5642161.1 rhamnosyltransferase [Cryobacterium roopkundense]
MPAEQPLATVVIPTYNGETYLRRILEMVSIQKVDGLVEILVIDSGSTDSTLEIVRDFPHVILHQIANSDFGHGKTRNLAAQLGTGTYIAYLTHDAVPLSEDWLRELITPFSMDDRIVAVMGKQVPRLKCFPLMKYEINGVFAQFGPDFGTTVFYKDTFVTNPGVLGAITFYSDVNSAARREVLVDRLPYRDVRYAEDQMFGQDLIEAGYHKAYAPRAAVEHSNDLTYSEFGARIFDETVGLRQIGTAVGMLDRKGMYRLIARGIAGDTLRILKDPQYTSKRRLYWLAINPFFQIRKWTSYRRAVDVDLADEAAILTGSLEGQRKTK